MFLLIMVHWFTVDDELRKKYDTYGEEGLKDNHFSNQYQSWNFYNEQFGIYDDDPEIITLSKADFGKCFCVLGFSGTKAGSVFGSIV